MRKVLLAVAITGFPTAVLSKPVYLSCVYETGPRFVLGSPLTFAFDENRREVLLGNGSPARSVVITPTEISFLHQGAFHTEAVPISIDRIGGRFRTTVSTQAGDIPANGSCTLTRNRQF